MKPVVIVARATAKPGKEEDLNHQLLELVKATHLEEGVLVYDLHRSTDNPAQFLMYEQYASQQAFEAHIAGQPLQHFLTLVPELVDGEVEIRQFALVSDPWLRP